MNKMEIREINRFSNRVFNATLRLLPQLAPDSAFLTREHFKGILKSKNTHFFIAELDNKIAGILTIATYDIPTGRKVWIEDVVVDESLRGKGIGKSLMLFAIDYAKSLGAKSIELTSRPSRVAANHLYQKMGFGIRETNVYKYLLNNK
jgi:ribosomal protein S18 acetylase RimI-like enzyme